MASSPSPSSSSQHGTGTTTTTTTTAPRPIPPALRPFLYLGVPRSVLTWKPRLPSRNMSIFLLTVSTLSYLYYDDRRECKRLRQHYIHRVRHLAQQPLPSWEYPRKVAVYGAMWPGDDDPDKSPFFFRKYVKPILVAAAIDWDVLHGTRPGGLARDLTARILARRRQLAQLEPWSDDLSQSKEPLTPQQEALLASLPPNPFALSPEQQLQRELDGCIVLLGRPALKEWAYAMKAGWTATLPLECIDADEQLARVLNEDSAFDELPDMVEAEQAAKAEAEAEAAARVRDDGEADGAGAPLPSRLNLPTQGTTFNPAFQQRPMGLGALASSPAQAADEPPSDDALDPVLHPVRAALARGINPALLEPPAQIPAQAPIVFVDHANPVGWRTIPQRLVGFFRHRDRVKLGGEAALRIALGSKTTAREFVFPDGGDAEDDKDTMPLFPLTSETRAEPIPPPPPQGGDLDWGLERESAYPPYFLSSLASIAKNRTQYYDALPKKLRETRTLERGLREPTRGEQGAYRPKTERELKQERLEREVEWRAEEHAFGVLRRESGVCWSPRWRGALRVMPEVEELPLPPPPPASSAEEGAQAAAGGRSAPA